MKKQQKTREKEGNTGFMVVFAIGAFLGALMTVLVKILRGSQIIRNQPPLVNNPSGSIPAPNLSVVSTQETTSSQPYKTQLAVEKPGSPVTNQVKEKEKLFSTWSNTTKYIVGIFLFLSFLGVIYLMRSVLSIVIFAALIAFIVQPIIDFFITRYHFKKGPAAMTTYLLVLLVLVLLPLIVVPAAIDAFNAVVNINYIAYIQSTREWINQTVLVVKANPYISMIFGPLLTSLSNLIATTSELEGAPRVPAFQLSMQTLGTGIASALGLLVNLLGPVVTAILTLIFTLLISLQISLAKDDFVNWYPTIAPVPYRKEFMDLVSETNKIWNRFLRGQLTLMVVIGGLTWIGNLILGTPQPLFLAIIAGLLEIIPNIGPFLATIPAVILALMFGSSYLPVSHLTFALIVVGLYVLIQALENNLIVPHVMGDAMDLSPVIVLIACLAGGSSFGLIGVFLATPVVATGRLLFNYLYGKMLESGPPPATEPEKPSFLEKLATYFQKLGRPLGDQPIDPSPPTPKAKIKSPPADKKNNSELSSDL